MVMYDLIKTLSNRKRYEIIEITSKKETSVSELSAKLKLAYNKTSDYLRELERLRLIKKIKRGKSVFIKSNVEISNSSISVK